MQRYIAHAVVGLIGDTVAPEGMPTNRQYFATSVEEVHELFLEDCETEGLWHINLTIRLEVSLDLVLED